VLLGGWFILGDQQLLANGLSGPYFLLLGKVWALTDSGAVNRCEVA
jgi:hypothetical protein